MSRFKILVVEDSRTSSMLIQSIFEESNKYKVDVAVNGSQAMHKIKNEKPDLILLDIMLPDIDGFTILKRLKLHQPTAAIPVIIVSAKDKAKDIAMGKELGAVDYVLKPIGTNKLYERVDEIISSLQT